MKLSCHNRIALLSLLCCGLLARPAFGQQPPNVRNEPRGRLEQLARDADLVFKGRVVSNTRVTNEAFRISAMEVESTRLEIITVLAGDRPAAPIDLQHYSGWAPGGHSSSGPPPPACYRFEPGQSSLIFAPRADK